MIKIKKEKENINFTKQQEVKKELVIVDNILPYNNHIVYEIDIKNKTINIADIIESKTIHWFEIIDGSFRDKNINKKEGCMYVSALNVSNLNKRVKKHCGLEIKDFTYITDNSTVVGSNLKVNIKDIK